MAVGSIMEFYPADDVHPSLFQGYTPPFAALVCGENEDKSVNLCAFNPNGVSAIVSNVEVGEPPAPVDPPPEGVPPPAVKSYVK